MGGHFNDGIPSSDLPVDQRTWSREYLPSYRGCDFLPRNDNSHPCTPSELSEDVPEIAKMSNLDIGRFESRAVLCI